LFWNLSACIGVPQELVVTAAPEDGALAASFDVTLAKA